MSPEDKLLKKIQIDALGEQWKNLCALERRVRHKKEKVAVRIAMISDGMGRYKGDGFYVREAGVHAYSGKKHLSPSQRRQSRQMLLEER